VKPIHSAVLPWHSITEKEKQMTKSWHQILRERTAAGYSRAALIPEGFDINKDDMATLNWVPVMTICKGIIGNLRGIDHPGRHWGIIQSLLNSEEESQLARLDWLPDNQAVVHYWKFSLTRKES
jgi:hypothetical protein